MYICSGNVGIILLNKDFDEYGVVSARWSDMGDFRIENDYTFHHDYAIWETMRNAFNFCKYLGKKNIHFLEYDNLPDEFQYRQAFLERINSFDAILYEYMHEGTYCATYIFSIKTDIAIQVIDQVKNKKEFLISIKRFIFNELFARLKFMITKTITITIKKLN